MEKVKVSIITITYNAEKTIATTIESVLGQDYENFEYIIVDGKSTDNTLEIIEKYRYRNQKITVISEKDNGIADAFNKGINIATGELIGLINADDYLLPHALTKLILEYEAGVDVIYGNTIVRDLENDLILRKRASDINKIRYELPFIHQSCFVRKDAYEKYGLYSTKFKICMDYELFARMYHQGAKFQYVDTYVSCFLYGGTSCKHPFKTINENVLIAEKYGLGHNDAVRYKIKLYFRNAIKMVLVKLGIWNFVYKSVKAKNLYDGNE